MSYIFGVFFSIHHFKKWVSQCINHTSQYNISLASQISLVSHTVIYKQTHHDIEMEQKN